MYRVVHKVVVTVFIFLSQLLGNPLFLRISVGMAAFILALLLLQCVTSVPVSDEGFETTIRMPGAISKKPDALVCHSVKLDSTETYILKYEPHARKSVTHHMMVYGCEEPASSKPYWSCEEMSAEGELSICATQHMEIIYAWANNAGPKSYPEGVGYRVSGNTKNKHVVIQLHYKDAFEDGQTDQSGITLHMTHKEQPKQAAFMVLGTWGSIPPRIPEYHMEAVCNFTSQPIYPLAYRTHSHNLGRVTSAYRIRGNDWTEIGRMSPQMPQTFYDVTTPGMDISPGDTLAVRCTMNSTSRDAITYTGARNVDEMCNFYIMYYTYDQSTLKTKYCFNDAQKHRWTDYFDKQTIPVSASVFSGLPDSEK